MKKSTSLNSQTLTLYYTRYKIYAVPVLVMCVCALLLVEVILPQAQAWLATQKVIEQNKAAIAVLNKNIDVLSGFDDVTLGTNLDLATAALPGDKDLLNSLGAINRATFASKVALADYTFQSDSVTKMLTVSLVVTGDLQAVQQFVIEIKNELPLATVDEIDYNSDSGSTIQVSFYYSTFPHFSYSAQTILPDLNSKQHDALSQLSSFDSALTQPAPVTLPVSTASAISISPIPSPSLKPTNSLPQISSSSASASKSAR